MRESSVLFRYSARLVVREWGRFVLPFLSLTITAVVMMVTLLLSTSSTMLLDNQAKELLGGDVVIESPSPIEEATTWSKLGITPRATSSLVEFSGTLESDEKTAPFSIKAVAGVYPLYGTVTLLNGILTTVRDGEIYLDATGAQRLNARVGSIVSFGSQDFTVVGIINTEPTALLAGFRFFPQALISQQSFTATGIDPNLLRAEYSILAKVDRLSNSQIAAVETLATKSSGSITTRIAGENRTGLQRGVQIVADFLIVAILITAVLAAVNVYASTLYLVTIERKSLAILLALGLTRARIMFLLAGTLAYVVIAASMFGVALGYIIFTFITRYVFSVYTINLPIPPALWYSLLCGALLVSIAIASFIPAVKRTLAPNPKQILSGAQDTTITPVGVRALVLTTGFALLPLGVLASLLLNSVVEGVVIIGATTLVYTAIAGVFAFVLGFVYRQRQRFSFTVRSVISQKKADGLFGIVSFASLFVALTALTTLSLLQIALERYLTEDLTQTVPSTYVLDIQPSQYEQFKATFPDVQLFSNIQARIKSIDDVQIQSELAQPETTVDRELGREFNLTARNDLLTNESIVAGVWGSGVAGEISVDESFAQRANITLGTRLVFLIQGFEVAGTVTSLRSTDSRSGVPFFYVVMSPSDVRTFPATYFGYANYDEAAQTTLGSYVAANTPNVSVIKTNTLAPLILAIVGTLMVLVLIVTIPPLLIATLLIVTLIVSSFSARRREGSRLRALGATRSFVLRQYLAETLSLTAVATLVAYVVSSALAYGISQYFFKLNTLVLFDGQLLTGLALIVVLVAVVGLYLFITDRKPLREILSYGDNN